MRTCPTCQDKGTITMQEPYDLARHGPRPYSPVTKTQPCPNCAGPVRPLPQENDLRRVLSERVAWLRGPLPNGCEDKIAAFPFGVVDAALIWAWEQVQKLESGWAFRGAQVRALEAQIAILAPASETSVSGFAGVDPANVRPLEQVDPYPYVALVTCPECSAPIQEHTPPGTCAENRNLKALEREPRYEDVKGPGYSGFGWNS